MQFRGWAKNVNRVQPVDAIAGTNAVSFPQGLVENARVSLAFYEAKRKDDANDRRLHLTMNEDETRDLRDKLQRALDAIENKRLRQAEGK